MIAFAVRRPVATVTALAGLAALGVPSARRMPLERLPDVELPRLEVSTAWPGASPEQVEAVVSAPIEAALQEVRGVRSVGSTSYAHRSVVTVEFEPGTEMGFARLDLTERLAALGPDLPAGALRPEVEPWVPPELAEGTAALLVYTVAGPRAPGALREDAERVLARDLAAVPGVGAVLVAGGSRRQIEVRLRPDRMAAFGIAPDDVRRAIGSGLNLAEAGGSLRIGERMITITIDDRAKGVADLEALVVVPEGARPAVRLGEIARVVPTYAEPHEVHRLDGVPAVALYLHRLPGTNAIDVVDRVRERLDRIETKLPGGTRVIEDYDGSEQIRRELDELRDRSLLSTGFVLLVLLVAFRRWRPALLVVAAIAVCVLATLSIMAMSGLTLNLLTLAGLAMGVGLIDDNAIVVLESIETRRSGIGGGSPGAERAAAWAGARQVVPPIMAASLTNLIVFLPFLYLQGELRAYYLPFAMTVGLALLASLVVAFTLIPALAARMGGRRVPVAPFHSRPARPARRIRPRVLYQDAISWTVHHPRWTAGSALLLLAACGWLFWEEVPRGRTFSGLGEQSFLTVQVTLPPGAGLEPTDQIARRIEARLGGIPAVDRYDTRVGPGHAWIHVDFPDSLARTGAPVAVKEVLLALSRRIGGASIRIHGFGPGFQGTGGASPGYGLELRGYDYRELERMAEDLAARLERFPRIRDVDPNAAGRWFERERETELVLAPDRERLAAYALSAEEFLGQVGMYAGAAAIHQTVSLAGEEADLSLGVEGAGEADVRALLDLPLAGGPPVRVGDVAAVHERTTMGRIVRDDQQYLRIVTWEFRGPRKPGDRARDAVIAATSLPAGYGLAAERSSWEYEEGEKGELALVVTLAVALVYMVTAALFESLKAPLVVLAAVPLAMVGVVLLYVLSDETFTREAWIGVVMMAGIVVNNAILVVDRIGALRRGADGPPLALEEAAVRGATERVRPILMTTGTTVLGLLPLVLFTGSGTASLWTALALATIGGLVSSTMLVLTTIPALYVLIRPRT